MLHFTPENIKNKDLILNMLKYEDSLYLSEFGQEILRNYGNVSQSIDGSKIIQRMTLKNFGFSPTDESLRIYRTIFQHYYNSSTDYDIDVLNSVFYMRENRCLYYTEPELAIGDKIPNVDLFNLDGKTKSNIYDILDKTKYKNCIIAAFSMS